MKKFLVGLLTSCIPFVLSAKEPDFTFGLGVRHDNFQWNIAGANDQPNILSELTWKNIIIVEGSFQIQQVSNVGFMWKGMASLGAVVSGNNQDSDYTQNDRQGEFSRSYASVDNYFTSDDAIALGFQYRGNCWTFAPLVGFSYHIQKYSMVDGELVINLDPENITAPQDPSMLGFFPLLDSFYAAQWWGPWLGFDITYEPFFNWILFTQMEFHAANYLGEGYWNLRDEFFDNFVHTSTGTGFVIRVGGDYLYNSCWSFGLKGQLQYWKAWSGRDRTFVAAEFEGEGFLPLAIDMKFNEAKWYSISLALTISYHF